MILGLLGLASAAFAVWVVWLLVDGIRALLNRRRLEGGKRAARAPLRLVVTARADHTPELFSLTLARADGKRPPRFLPGQYLTVRLPAEDGQSPVARRYSLSAWSPRPRAYRLGIRRVEGGKVSGWLHAHARPGTALEVLPPAGEFVLQPDSGETVLVGGGIGLTPMAAMVDALSHKPAGRVWLFHATRQAGELVGQPGYAELERAAHWFCYRPTLSRPGADWSGGRGRLSAVDLTRELADPAAAHYYLCARQEMMDELAAGLAEQGVPNRHIHRESFGGGDNTDARAYKVQVGGQGLHVFQGEPSLLHAMEAWGIPVEADCRAGDCGACRMRLKRGELRECQAPTPDARRHLGAGQFLACCVAPATDLEIELLAS
jgi:ferredoxin-NADP reductase